jgi:hypothetical protein
VGIETLGGSTDIDIPCDVMELRAVSSLLARGASVGIAVCNAAMATDAIASPSLSLSQNS